MVCRGDPWEVPWFAGRDAVEGSSAGGASACTDQRESKEVVRTLQTRPGKRPG